MNLKLNFAVAENNSQISLGFDRIKIIKNDTEITSSSSRIFMAKNVPCYLFEIPNGRILDSYSYQIINSSNNTLGEKISITLKTAGGYCSVESIRSEGFQQSVYKDSDIQDAIDQATKTIDEICGQRFEPYYAKIIVTTKKGFNELLLDFPICSLFKCEITSDNLLSQNFSSVNLQDLIVSNRHLTQGFLNPDDRLNPKISFSSSGFLGKAFFNSGRFPKGERSICLHGIFGFTDLDYIAGETEDGSQQPLTYGSTPLSIKRAAKLLTSMYLPKIADGSGVFESFAAMRMTAESTADQSYSLSSGSTNDQSFGMTGNIEVDKILSRFMSPMKIGIV